MDMEISDMQCLYIDPTENKASLLLYLKSLHAAFSVATVQRLTKTFVAVYIRLYVYMTPKTTCSV